MCKNREAQVTPMRKINDQSTTEKRTAKKDNGKIHYKQILRKTAIAAAKASKYGWPTAPNDTQYEEEAEAEKKAQEEVIHILSKACAAASVVCRDFITSTYPRDSEIIMAQKMQRHYNC